MFIITKSVYGGTDYKDSYTVNHQMQRDGSYDIGKENMADAIAEDIAGKFPYVDNIRKKVMHAVAGKTSFQIEIMTAKKDADGNVVYMPSECVEVDGQQVSEDDATFDGNELTLTESFMHGQALYITTYHPEDIPDGQVGYIVTENFPYPKKGVSLVERLYHEIFNSMEDAKQYADSLAMSHGRGSDIILLICNRNATEETKWYKQQKEAMDLMDATGQTCCDDSFSLFVDEHVRRLKKLA